MFSRTYSRAALIIASLLVTACSSDELARAPEETSAPKIACALAGAAAFETSCTLSQQGEIITLSAPNGGFRRLRIVPGGVEAADGAEPAIIIPLKDIIEVRIGNDVYRLPAQTR